jgi:hypothetical protein
VSLTFDPATHTYTLDGRVVPSVTQVLRALPNEYAMVDPDVLERAAEIGRAVHWIIEHEILGDLDEELVDFHLLPYLDQWRAFRRTSGFEPLLSEGQVWSRRYRYAGTLDLFGRLNGRKALIDAKRTAAVPRSAGPQTAGYRIALSETHPDLLAPDEPVDRFALHLTPNRWQLVPFRAATDQRVFLSALTIYQWSKSA